MAQQPNYPQLVPIYIPQVFKEPVLPAITGYAVFSREYNGELMEGETVKRTAETYTGPLPISEKRAAAIRDYNNLNALLNDACKANIGKAFEVFIVCEFADGNNTVIMYNSNREQQTYNKAKEVMRGLDMEAKAIYHVHKNADDVLFMQAAIDKRTYVVHPTDELPAAAIIDYCKAHGLDLHIKPPRTHGH